MANPNQRNPMNRSNENRNESDLSGTTASPVGKNGVKSENQSGQRRTARMDHKVDTGRFDFVGKIKLFGALSALAVLGSLILIATKGFVYGIDFAGGTEMLLDFTENVKTEKVRDFFDQSVGIKNVEIQSYGDKHGFLVRFDSPRGATERETNEMLNSTIKRATEALKSEFAASGVTIQRVETVGPQVGNELKRNGLLAGFYCLLIILIYVGLRFDYQYAPGAVICLFHDTVITLGIFSLLGKPVSVQTMAAVLTLIGYSLNDTIINFDRIRENLPIFRNLTPSQVVNRSVNDVLVRTILTSFTTFLAVASLYFLAGGVIEDLAFTLAVGIVIGSYSSIYIANPLFLLFDKYVGKRKTLTV